MSSVPPPPPPPPPPPLSTHQRTRKTVARRKAPLSLGEQISAARHKLAASAHLTEDRSAPVLKAQHEEKTAEEDRQDREFFFATAAEKWLATLHHVTFKSISIPLTDAVARFLAHRQPLAAADVTDGFESASLDTTLATAPCLRELVASVDAAIQSFGKSGAFVKLSTRSPKDSTVGARHAVALYTELVTAATAATTATTTVAAATAATATAATTTVATTTAATAATAATTTVATTTTTAAATTTVATTTPATATSATPTAAPTTTPTAATTATAVTAATTTVRAATTSNSSTTTTALAEATATPSLNTRYRCWLEASKDSLRVTSGRAAICHFLCSARVKEDLQYALECVEGGGGRQLQDIVQVVVREWNPLPLGSEFRCFVWDGRFTAMTQYHHRVRIPWANDQLPRITRDIRSFVARTMPLIPADLRAHCIIDVAWGPDAVLLIEINPFDGFFGASAGSTGLFDWDDAGDRAIMQHGPFECRMQTRPVDTHWLRSYADPLERQVLFPSDSRVLPNGSGNNI